MVEGKEGFFSDVGKGATECLAVNFRNLLTGNEVCERVAAERDDELGSDERDLGVEPGLAGGDFFRERIAIVRRAVLDDIGDVDVLSPEVDAFEHYGQVLSRCPDKGYPLQILTLSWRLTDEQDV